MVTAATGFSSLNSILLLATHMIKVSMFSYRTSNTYIRLLGTRHKKPALLLKQQRVKKNQHHKSTKALHYYIEQRPGK